MENVKNSHNIIIDYDKDRNVVGIEMLDASKKMKKPGSLVYEVE